MSVIRFEGVSKIFRTRHGTVKALDQVTFHVRKGEFLVIRGPSGSGKTTLLLCAGGMLRPTQGCVTINGQEISGMNERARARFRATNIGFVFQMFYLVPYLNVMENILLAAGPAGGSIQQSRAQELIEQLGLSDRRYHKPAQLSAGERQRAALGRALFPQPKIILADEPTGNLDPENAAEVFRHLKDFQTSGGTVILVTHGTAADPYAGRILSLQQGRIEE